MRIAFIAGTLGRGGTERQSLHMIRALVSAGCDVRVCCLTRGEYFEPELRQIGVDPWWVGRFSSPLARLTEITARLAAFRPQIIQATHSFVNLYAALAARVLRAKSVGALRCQLQLSRRDNGRWTPWLVSAPDALLVNSWKVRDQLKAEKIAKVYCLPNRVEGTKTPVPLAKQTTPVAIFVGRLVPEKRLDVFLRALTIAQLPALIVGDGPELTPMRALAAELALNQRVTFLGMRDDVANLFAQADMLVLSSDSEGSPNVILEAMAAGLPVITTPAGDAGLIVKDGKTGYVVPFGDAEAMAARMLQLAAAPELRIEFGEAGRQTIQREFTTKTLAEQLLDIYRELAGEKQRGVTVAWEPTCKA
jgi:glycosyltransferase involved in cell wall biosynthesis